MKKILIALTLALASVSIAAETKTETVPTFTGDALKVKTWLDELFAVSQKVNTPKSDSNPNRKKVLEALDWEMISKECLGKDVWNKQTKKRGEFQALLKDVIAYTAWGRLGEFWKNTQYQFKKIDVKGDTATVTSQFKSGADTISLDYYLIKKGTHWYIRDISLEGLKYSEDIKEKLDSYLSEKSFDELLKSLRKRLADLKEDKDDAKPAKKKKAS